MNTEFSTDVEQNIAHMEQQIRMEENFDILKREVMIGGKKAGFFFIDGFVESAMVEKLMQFFYSLKPEDVETIDAFLEHGMPYTEVNKLDKMDTAVTCFLAGITVVFVDGFNEAITMDCRTYPVRSVAEPWKDRVLRGSRDGFVETLVYNVALVRRRVRDPQLSFELFGVGIRSRSDVTLCYIADKVDRKILQNIRKRIQDIKVEALTMNIESLAECLYDKKWISPFPKFKYSERPDTAAAAVLDGNIVIMVDNSPAVMIIPSSVFDIIEEADDYNFAPVIGTYLRLSRFVITFVTLLLTPTWLLFLNHPQWLPNWLSFITVSDEITVPVFFQLLILEMSIDGLKLAAVNTPTLLSTPLSVVAGIVVGEYAVSSGWFNAESMLYMAVVSIGTYSQSSFEMGYALKFMRILLLVLTGLFGIYGYVTGIIITLAVMACNNTITGLSYIYPLVPFDAKMLKRKIFRLRLPHGKW